jgi:hypothetical protein
MDVSNRHNAEEKVAHQVPQRLSELQEATQQGESKQRSRHASYALRDSNIYIYIVAMLSEAPNIVTIASQSPTSYLAINCYQIHPKIWLTPRAVR